MPTPDLPIFLLAVEAAPKDFQLSGRQELSPLAVRAEIDGTGAAGAFLPALQLIAPGGKVMWTAVTSSTVAAGASADVSWFPRVGEGGGGSGTDPNAVHYGVNGETGTFVDSRTTTGGYSFLDESSIGVGITSGTFGAPGFIGLDTRDGTVSSRAALIILRASSRIQFQDVSGNIMYVFDAAGGSAQKLSVGEIFEVDDHLGNPILEVREDGTIHGRAAVGAITWDL